MPLDDRGSNSGKGKAFIWSQNLRARSEAHPASYSTKWSGRGVDHPLPPSAEVKNEWSYSSTSPIRIQVVNTANFTFTRTNVCIVTAGRARSMWRMKYGHPVTALVPGPTNFTTCHWHKLELRT